MTSWVEIETQKKREVQTSGVEGTVTCDLVQGPTPTGRRTDDHTPGPERSDGSPEEDPLRDWRTTDLCYR